MGRKDKLFKIVALRLRSTKNHGLSPLSARVVKKQKVTATLHPVRAGEAVSQLAFEQMIYFVADGMKIIQAEVNNGIADVRNLVHFL